MKTLIAYSTKHGATRKYAQALARELSGDVTLTDLQKEPGLDVSSFDQVVIGGAVYFGQVRPELKDFCARNLNALQQKRLGLFICCWFEGEQAAQELQSAFPKELHEAAVAEAVLGGELTWSGLNFGERLISRMIGVKSDASRYNETALKKFAAGLRG